MPQLKGTPGFRIFDDPEKDFLLEYPKSWVGRANRQRLGLSVSDFNVSSCCWCILCIMKVTGHITFGKATCLCMQSSDKLVVEIFPEPQNQDDQVRSILEHLISPGQEVGGDSRLLIPSNNNVVTAEEEIGGQVSASFQLL